MNDDTKQIVQVNGKGNTMYGTDDSFSDSDSEMSGAGESADQNELSSSLNKGLTQSKVGKKDSRPGAASNKSNDAVKIPSSFQIQDLELDTSFEV